MDRTVKIWKLTDTSRIMGRLLLVAYFDWLIDHVYNDLIHCSWADSLWLSVTQKVTVALQSAFGYPPKRCSVLTGWDVVGAIQNGCHLCACSVHTLQPCFSLVLFKATCVHPVRKCMLVFFWYLGNPPNSDMDSRTFNACMWSFCMHVHTGDVRRSFGWVASLVVFFLQCASGLGLSFQFCGLQIYMFPYWAT